DVIGRTQNTGEHLAVFYCLTQPDFDTLTNKTQKIGFVAQRAIRTRRTHFETFVIDVLDFEHPRQLTRNLLAIFDTHTFDTIDGNAQQPLRSPLHTAQFNVSAREGFLRQRKNICHKFKKKWAVFPAHCCHTRIAPIALLLTPATQAKRPDTATTLRKRHALQKQMHGNAAVKPYILTETRGNSCCRIDLPKKYSLIP